MAEKMNAIVVEQYGDIQKLVHKQVPKPSEPEEWDVLIE